MRIRQTTNENVYVSEEQVIDRSGWVCGIRRDPSKVSEGIPDNVYEAARDATGRSAMLNTEGFMCCLGHVCHNAGFGKDLLLGKDFPENVIAGQDVFLDIPDLTRVGDYGSVRDSDFADKAAKINDDSDLSPKERERDLTVVFKEYGMKLKFVGRYPAAVRAYHKERFGE